MPNSAQTLEPAKALPILATLSNDPSRKGVTWKLLGAGSLVAETNTSVMYLAPPSVSTQESVTVTAIPIAGSRPASLTIVLIPQKASGSAQADHSDQKGQGARR